MRVLTIISSATVATVAVGLFVSNFLFPPLFVLGRFFNVTARQSFDVAMVEEPAYTVHSDVACGTADSGGSLASDGADTHADTHEAAKGAVLYNR